MASSFGMNCVRKNFLFLLTGIGRGCFNIFIGTMLFIFDNSDSVKTFILAWAMILGGFIFIFLSKYKNISDEDLQRAVSVTRKSVVNNISGVAYNNREAIGQVAYDNRDVIAQVAYDNRDVIA